MTPIQEPQEIEIPRGVVAEASAPLPVIQFPDGSTEPAPAGSVKAEDIIGLITSEQIEELEAAKIGGKLTAEQIENVHAASIIGEIINSQIKGMGVGKLEGQVTAAQIAANSIIAEKIAVGAVITEKIAAGAITTGKLAAEAITAEKISASAITTSKIAAGAITVEKITVAELSGITPKLGTITAGTIEGVNIKLPQSPNPVTFPEESKIDWLVGGKLMGFIVNYGNAEGPGNTSSHMQILSNTPEAVRQEGYITIEANSKANHNTVLRLSSQETQSLVQAVAGGRTVDIITNTGASSFVQLGGTFRAGSMTWGNGGVSVGPNSEVRVTHGLGVTPETVNVSPAANTNVNFSVESPNATTFGIKNFHPSFGAFFYWSVMGA